MPLIKDPLAQVMRHALAFTNRRQDVIASNIANADTPGYKAFDVVLRKSLGGSKNLEPTRTNSRHLSMDESGSSLSGLQIERSREPARLDGNNVNLDQELTRLLENKVKYQVGMELFDRWNGLKAIARTVR